MDRLATIVLVLAWGYGFVVLGWSVRRWPERSDRPSPIGRLVGAAGLAAIALSLGLPWVSGTAADTDARLVLSGWQGLDPLTTSAVVVLAAAAAAYLASDRGGDARRSIRSAQALCLTGLLGGNALIHTSDATATSLGVGGAVGVVGAVLLLVSAVVPGVTVDERVGSTA